MPDPQYNVLLTRVIADLYRHHPSPLNLISDEIWDPPLKRTDADYAQKSATSGGTLTWLYRNGFVSGDYKETQTGAVIFKAQLTSHGYRMASQPQINYGNMPLGQVAIDAVANPSETRFAWVAQKFAER